MFRPRYPIIAPPPCPVIRMLEFGLEGPMILRVATIFDTLHENLASGLWKGRLTLNKERSSKVVVMMILTMMITQMILTITKIMMMMTMMMNIQMILTVTKTMI